MCRVTGCVLVFGVSVFVMVGLTACGSGGGIPGGAVAQVGGSSISKAALDHWTPIEAVLASGHSLHHPIPRGVVPVPPHYTACIIYLEAGAAASQPVKNQSKTTLAAMLKDQCRERYEALRTHMLGILIAYEWVLGEAADQGIKVTDEEVKQELERSKHEQYPTEAEFQKFLTVTGESVSDELLLTKKSLLSEKITQKLTGTRRLTGHPHNPQALVKYAKEYTKKWTAKTNCRPQYTAPGCKQYKGPLAPES